MKKGQGGLHQKLSLLSYTPMPDFNIKNSFYFSLVHMVFSTYKKNELGPPWSVACK